MNNQFKNMNKEDVISTIQQTVELFQQDVNSLDSLFSIEDSLHLLPENNIVLTKQLENLVSRLRELKEKDNEMYESILLGVKNISPFALRVEESIEMKTIVSKSVISTDTDVNARQLANIMKSSDIFDFINRDKKEIKDEDFKIFGNSAPYVQILWKQVKQEELLGLLLYVNSGKAAKDFEDLKKMNFKTKSIRDNFLYTEFKKSFYHLKLKDHEVIISEKKYEDEKVSSANYLDYGVVVNHDKKELHFGFATSNYDTSTQRKQFFAMMKGLENNIKDEQSIFFGYELKPIYITNSIVNENELKFGQSEKQKPFLKTFEEELTKQDRNILNVSSYLAMFNNVSHNDMFKDMIVTSLLKANPYISGADTLHMYESFKEISCLDDVNKSLRLRNYLLNSASDLLDVIEKVRKVDASENFMHYIHGMVFQNFKNIITAAKNNFVGLLCKEDFLNDIFIGKVENIMERAAHIHLEKFMGLEPAKNGGLSEFLSITDIHGNMNSLHTQFQKLQVVRSNVNQLTLDIDKKNSEKQNFEDAGKSYSRIMPLLKEMNVFNETDLHKMMDHLAFLYNDVKMKPGLQSIKDVLNDSSNSQLKEWGKNYNTIIKSDAKTLRKQTQREILRTIFENIKDLGGLENNIKQYHEDFIRDIKFIKKKKIL